MYHFIYYIYTLILFDADWVTESMQGPWSEEKLKGVGNCSSPVLPYSIHSSIINAAKIIS